MRRFLGSLRPGGPSAADDAWAVAALTPAEVALWRRMSTADRRHGVDVALRTDAGLGARATRPVVAAALLHDVGKIDSALGPFRRAAATVLAMVRGQGAVVAATRHRDGELGRIGRYLRHDENGAGLLAAAGSDALTVAWAGEHHLPPERWTLPPEVAAALKAADDD